MLQFYWAFCGVYAADVDAQRQFPSPIPACAAAPPILLPRPMASAPPPVSYSDVPEICYALPQMREQTVPLATSPLPSGNAELLQVLCQATACDPRAVRAWPVLNGEERDLFDRVLVPWAERHRLRLMAQVSMGEFLRSDVEGVRKTFNAKRVDFLIADWLCNPVLAVEYFGGLHDQGDAPERDAIKAEALASARIGLLIVEERYDAEALRAVLDDILSEIQAERTVHPVFAMGPGEPIRRAS